MCVGAIAGLLVSLCMLYPCNVLLGISNTTCSRYGRHSVKCPLFDQKLRKTDDLDEKWGAWPRVLEINPGIPFNGQPAHKRV